MNNDTELFVRPPPRWKKKARLTPPTQKPSWVTSWISRLIVLIIAVLVPLYVFFRSQPPFSHVYSLLLSTDLVNVESHNNAAFQALQDCSHSSSQTVVASLGILTDSISRSGQQHDRLASYITGTLTSNVRKAWKTRQCTDLKNAGASLATAENYTHEAKDTLSASLPLYKDTESLVQSAYDDTQGMLGQLTKPAPFPVVQGLIGWASAIVGGSSWTVKDKVKKYETIEDWSMIYEEVDSDLQASGEAVRLQILRLDRYEADMKLIQESIPISLEEQNSSDTRCSTFDFEMLERFFLGAVQKLVGDDVEARRFSEHFHSSRW